MSALILRPSPVGEMAHEINVVEADDMVKSGKAVKLEHLIYRELPANAYAAKVMEVEKKVVRRSKTVEETPAVPVDEAPTEKTE